PMMPPPPPLPMMPPAPPNPLAPPLPVVPPVPVVRPPSAFSASAPPHDQDTRPRPARHTASSVTSSSFIFTRRRRLRGHFHEERKIEQEGVHRTSARRARAPVVGRPPRRGGGQVVGRVHQRQVRERLREIAEKAPPARVVLLRQQAHVV